eukprot:TRINITY_DN44172_c0_g1_i3.p1 TRINITY_DN44172_c0_g1~~TRINITY_DN44172_c0_g1_i3.p1  ORF type:complete len:312 (-),score=105.02 TRINITY_DN44172_c0_g1_i3:395-1330(-)
MRTIEMKWAHVKKTMEKEARIQEKQAAKAWLKKINTMKSAGHQARVETTAKFQKDVQAVREEADKAAEVEAKDWVAQFAEVDSASRLRRERIASEWQDKIREMKEQAKCREAEAEARLDEELAELKLQAKAQRRKDEGTWRKTYSAGREETEEWQQTLPRRWAKLFKKTSIEARKRGYGMDEGVWHAQFKEELTRAMSKLEAQMDKWDSHYTSAQENIRQSVRSAEDRMEAQFTQVFQDNERRAKLQRQEGNDKIRRAEDKARKWRQWNTRKWATKFRKAQEDAEKAEDEELKRWQEKYRLAEMEVLGCAP